MAAERRQALRRGPSASRAVECRAAPRAPPSSPSSVAHLTVRAERRQRRRARRPRSRDHRRRGRSARPRATRISTYRSPGGPPRSPACPRPDDPDSLAVADPGGHVDRDLAARPYGRDRGSLARIARGPGRRRRTRRRPRSASTCPNGVRRHRASCPGAAAPGCPLSIGRARLGAVAVAVLAQRDRLIAHLDESRRAACARSSSRRRPRHRRPGSRRRRRPPNVHRSRRRRTLRIRRRTHRRCPRHEPNAFRSSGAVSAASQALVAVAIVGRAAVGVRQHLVGLRRLLELLLGFGIVAVDVGVQFASQAAERLLDRGLIGGTGDAENVVVVPSLALVRSIARRRRPR